MWNAFIIIVSVLAIFRAFQKQHETIEYLSTELERERRKNTSLKEQRDNWRLRTLEAWRDAKLQNLPESRVYD